VLEGIAGSQGMEVADGKRVEKVMIFINYITFYSIFSLIKHFLKVTFFDKRTLLSFNKVK